MKTDKVIFSDKPEGDIVAMEWGAKQGELAMMQLDDNSLYSAYTTPDSLGQLGIVENYSRYRQVIKHLNF